ncbi:MAG TPA: hypothetical protein VHG92_02790 [Afifellaceae bacterium]|nr:hypothetical protein [Afifellaceae bacterium]
MTQDQTRMVADAMVDASDPAALEAFLERELANLREQGGPTHQSVLRLYELGYRRAWVEWRNGEDVASTLDTMAIVVSQQLVEVFASIEGEDQAVAVCDATMRRVIEAVARGMGAMMAARRLLRRGDS